MVTKYTKNVGREMVEKAGVNVDALIDKLKKAAAAEFTTYYYYTLLRMHCTGLEGETVKEIAEDARLEDRLHFETLAPRIYELGGELYRDLTELHEASACSGRSGGDGRGQRPFVRRDSGGEAPLRHPV